MFGINKSSRIRKAAFKYARSWKKVVAPTAPKRPKVKKVRWS